MQPRVRVPFAIFTFASFAGLVALSLLWPSTALGYCRTRTCEFEGTSACDVDPSTSCSLDGEFAHWKSGCISYAVQADGSEVADVSADELRELLDSGFRSWSEVQCSPGSAATPPLSSHYRGNTACDEVEYNCGAASDNANIAMFRDDDSDLSPFTIALSTIIANLRTGEILDVDIEINSQDFDFYLDDASASDEAHDLRLVINHELGHFLGLSHTLTPGALMRSEYEGSDQLPVADDIAGMCSILPASMTDPSCTANAVLDACVGRDGRCPVAVKAKESGCSLALESGAASGGAPAAALAAASLLLLGRARRRRPAPSPQVS